MPQYFENDPNIASHLREVFFVVGGRQFNFTTDSGVFSKSKIDEGSAIFLNELISLPLKGRILDLGCGYGVIGIVLASVFPSVRVDCVDVNDKALELTRTNALKNGVSSKLAVFRSDVYENVEGPYDSIVVNPPIRAGKAVIYKMFSDSWQYLIDGGSLFVVIRKNQGAVSASNYIKEQFGNIKLLCRNKGYHVYQATKMGK